MPFKSKKQRTYLAINEPDVYKKFKKEETMIKRAEGGPSKKRKKETRKKAKALGKLGKLAGGASAGALASGIKTGLKKGRDKKDIELSQMLGRLSSDIKRMKDKEMRDKFGTGLPDTRRGDPLDKVSNPSGRMLNKGPRLKPGRNVKGEVTKRPMGGKVYKNTTKRNMGGKVYKVDNAGQMMVQRMYGGKLGF